MKTQLVVLIVLSAFTIVQSETRLVGLWKNDTGNRTIQFYQSGNFFEGKITEDSDPIMIGKVIFQRLKFNGKFYEGSAFLPKKNRSILCSLKLIDSNILEITGKVGIITDTKIWKRK